MRRRPQLGRPGLTVPCPQGCVCANEREHSRARRRLQQTRDRRSVHAAGQLGPLGPYLLEFSFVWTPPTSSTINSCGYHPTGLPFIPTTFSGKTANSGADRPSSGLSSLHRRSDLSHRLRLRSAPRPPGARHQGPAGHSQLAARCRLPRWPGPAQPSSRASGSASGQTRPWPPPAITA